MASLRARVAFAAFVAIVVIVACASRSAQAEIVQQFVMVGRVAAVLNRSTTGPAPHIGIVYENGSGVGSTLCKKMAEQGFAMLCAIETSRPSNGWEDVALDIKANIEFLRSQPGITKVILYGHSGGGAVASFYQAVAENGLAFCQDPKKLSACKDNLANLPPADGVVFPDAHPGLAIMDLRQINPSVSIEGTQLVIDPALDPFSPANGFNPNGPSHFSAAFQKRYFAAQANIGNALIEKALAIQAGVRSGAITSPVAQQVVVPGAGRAAHLDEIDPAIAVTMSTIRPERLLKNDGSMVTQKIVSSSVGNPEAAKMPSTSAIAPVVTYLSRNAVRATDSMSEIDWCTSNSVTICNTRSIHVPVLFIAMGANTFITDEERMYDGSPAKDKEYIVVEGALHGGQACVPCEKTPGQYANSESNMYAYIRDWINKRF
jgi:pimeloyl-ACP methyl ester carboxylesterase